MDEHQVPVNDKEFNNFKLTPDGKHWARYVYIAGGNTLGGVYLTDPAGNPIATEIEEGKLALDVNVVGGVTIGHIDIEHENDDILIYGIDSLGVHHSILTDDQGRIIISPNTIEVDIDDGNQTPVVVKSDAYYNIINYTIPVGKSFYLKQIELSMLEGAFCEIRIEKVSGGVLLKRSSVLSQVHPRDTFIFNGEGIKFVAGDVLQIRGKTRGSDQDANILVYYSGILM